MARRYGLDITQATRLANPAASDDVVIVSGGGVYRALISKIVALASAEATAELAVRTLTGAGTASSADNIINCDTDTLGADLNLTLSSVSDFWTAGTSRTKVLTVKNTGSTYNVVIGTTSSQLIDGQSSAIVSPYTAIQIYTNGTAWFVLA